jgi:hypothetical protein
MRNGFLSKLALTVTLTLPQSGDWTKFSARDTALLGGTRLGGGVQSDGPHRRDLVRAQ